MKALTAAVLGGGSGPRTTTAATSSAEPTPPPAPSSASSAPQVVAARLANGCALAASELAHEPRRGLLLVAEHVQQSAPELLAAARGARVAARRIDALAAELAEARAALEELEERVRWWPDDQGGG
jgi:hypothetical protein